MPHPGPSGQRRLCARSVRRLGAAYGLDEIVRFAPLDDAAHVDSGPPSRRQ
jgi:hypothetical protein